MAHPVSNLSVESERGQLPPLCVDLDGTLVRSDLLKEAMARFIVRGPWRVFAIIAWLIRGRAWLKHQIARRVAFDPEPLPYRPEVLALLNREAARGRELYLCTAADQIYAESVARHLGIFKGVFASDGTTNLSGVVKRQALDKTFGAQKYAYIGDSAKDVPVWSGATECYVVNPSRTILNRATKEGISFERSVGTVPAYWSSALRALRVHQWVKNLLLFVPLTMAHAVTNLSALAAVGIGFLAFSAVASAVYILNDLMDLDADRAHRSKSRRPFASGELCPLMGLAAIPALVTAGSVAAFVLPAQFSLILFSYGVLTTLYTFAIKKIAVLDVLALAGLYTTRILAGGAAASIAVSPWLLGFSLFLFFSLACVKRYTELLQINPEKSTGLSGRGYLREDTPLIGMMGLSSGYLAVVVLALYVTSDAVVALYSTPSVIWLLCPLVLYWLSRSWLLAYRGQLDDDPVVFALRDPVSYVVVLCAMAVVALAR